ncbi:MAG: hypothetical protein EOP53_05565 [Sphingobacteriales bacterium]|nr:MAG: hypothetical protein EOP53_05565 [Sphingobacteriales bacterium]
MAQPSDRPYRRKRLFSIRDEWKGFVFCLALAGFLWLLTVLSETYNSRVSVNVNYINRPKNLVFTNQLPGTLLIRVTATGWDLLGYYLRGRGGDVTLNLEEYGRRSFLLTNSLKNVLQAQIEGKVTVHDIYPDTISLRREVLFTKKVPVKLNLDISFKDQYGIAGDIVFSPDSIEISGSKETIPGIQYIESSKLTVKNLSKTLHKIIPIKKSATQNISYKVDRINITIPIDQLTEKVVEVPIAIVNPKFAGTVRLIPSTATISYQTTLEKYHQIDENQFEVIVDGQKMDTVTKSPLKIQLLNYPKYIYKPRLYQEHVDYIITR